jgi:hypothetical protein
MSWALVPYSLRKGSEISSLILPQLFRHSIEKHT